MTPRSRVATAMGIAVDAIACHGHGLCTEMLPEMTTIEDPAISRYASPHALAPVLGSTPHVGWLGVSVATANALQSDLNVGNDSWTEQPHPSRLAVVKSENDGFDAISETAPPQGGVPSIVHVPEPSLSASTMLRISVGWKAPAHVASKYMPVRPG